MAAEGCLRGAPSERVLRGCGPTRSSTRLVTRLAAPTRFDRRGASSVTSPASESCVFDDGNDESASALRAVDVLPFLGTWYPDV
jgi:hypothetical protein